MSDERPRPQYGEYATPEQQAAAMGQKYVPPAPAPEPPAAEPTAAERATAQAYPQAQTGYANRFLTIFLLGLGALNLFSSVPGYLSLASTLKSVMSVYSTSSISVPASVNAAGVPILIANVVIYGLTVWLSALRMRRGRASVYIPILGFFVFALVFGILLAVYSPGYVSQLQG